MCLRVAVSGLVTLTATAMGICFAGSAPAIYRIKLERFVIPPNRPAGLLVKARINGGPPLRLLVDSGSQYVVLNRAAARRSHCSGGADLELVGAGAESSTLVKRQTADTLEIGDEIGDLTLRDAPLLVVDRRSATAFKVCSRCPSLPDS